MAYYGNNPPSIGLPKKQGLYDPAFEHDACGVGFVAHMKGQKSHSIVEEALQICLALEHRGACGCEVNTGDGAGMLLQVSDRFFRKVTKESSFTLPELGQYGVGLVYFPKDEEQRSNIQNIVEKIVEDEGQRFLGWRDVPVDNSDLGATALACEPHLMQLFIGRDPAITDDLAFERKLYIIRRVCSHAIRYQEIEGGEYFYFTSLSARTIVYKGMLTPDQLNTYFPDLHDEAMESSLALVHSRFSTNTFPSWPRAHPYRYMSHNGEINTLRGNVNWMHARQALFASEAFGDDLEKILPVIREDGSDSAMFDNALEFMVLAGRPLAQAVMMMIPEPWEKHESMDEKKKAFYEYHACMMEPWDGPASIAFTDGTCIGAVLDRNGLRPSRYYVTKDDRVIMASEVGVLPVDPENVAIKGRLEPGRMFLIDLEEGRIIGDTELKEKIATAKPYGKWLDKNLVALSELPDPADSEEFFPETLLQKQKAFGYTFEDKRFLLGPMAQTGVQPLGSMGNDAPLAVLSSRSQLLFSYFKQLFAQVTNPAIDPIREEIVTATTTFIGSEADLLHPGEKNCRMLKLDCPIVDNKQLEQIRRVFFKGFKSATLPILFTPESKVKGLDSGLPDRLHPEVSGRGLVQSLEQLFNNADQAIRSGVNLLILSDKGINGKKAGIPSLLAVAGLHHHLIRKGTRTKVSIILESGEPREVMHFALLLGYGADVINPYLALKSLQDMIVKGDLELDYDKACKNYIKAAISGVVKTMSKMGISTVASYRGAQIFEAIGLNQQVIDEYFTWTSSRVEGIGLETIAQEVKLRHQKAFYDLSEDSHTLDPGGLYQWRKGGEKHLWSPESLHKLQVATRTGSYEIYKEYAALINDQSEEACTLRGLMEFKTCKPVPLEEVEPVEAIVKRFKTGAMSYGSISKEAHEALAIAMNRLGGRSNTGEGGEDPARFIPDANGDSRKSAIKQVASGRFGVTSNYLVNSEEIQIKISQGAKPGEGGELPGHKVFPAIAKVRGTTPGVGLISPPPHHDIYSIEDLAELVHDLKNANHHARINVKLVAEIGVGTIAAGVAKGHADVILISGHDGGTGASPRSSIQHAGAPWELGVAETNQILLMNDLRSRVVLEADGQMKTGRDVVIAALLGAEEFGFATAPLVTLGCLLMRVCHKNTCPVGIATQNPELRKKYMGNPDYVVNYMRFVAQEMREIMAQLGFRTVLEMVGRSDMLEMNPAVNHWKSRGLDFTRIFYRPELPAHVGTYCQISQDHGLDKALDNRVLLKEVLPKLKDGQKVNLELPIVNTDRVVGTILGSEISRIYGAEGLPENTVNLKFNGSAGQSFGAFTPKGMTFTLEGDSNDYIGKGLSGSRLIVYPPKNATFVPEENIIVGNVAFYGATAGEAFIRGVAGERFCVRNSGVSAIVEGVGDHGCEYMTGGRVINIGKTGRNFASGMSGGIAYIFDADNDFEIRLNKGMVSLYRLIECEDQEIAEVREMIERHVQYTGSNLAQSILDQWDDSLPKFLKVLPRDYERMLNCYKMVEEQGLSGDEADMAAFEANIKDMARLSGK